MSKFMDLCLKYFNSQNFYEILSIERGASTKQVRKSYHKLSLKVHPDRVDEENKDEATEKFKILGRIYSVLSCKDKRALYDQNGTIDDEDNKSDLDWVSFWKSIFKPISFQDYRDYEDKYKGSVEETNDLRKAYVMSKGNMDTILETVPFSKCADEPRFKTIIQKLIEEGEVQEYDGFVNESPKKAARRKRRYAAEERESALLATPEDLDESGEALRLMLRNRQRERGDVMSNFIDQLEAKYGDNKASPSSKKPINTRTQPARKRKAT